MDQRWSVAVVAEGDRIVSHDEVLELADAVAGHEGIASGIGTNRYGAQIVVLAPDRDEALARGRATFQAAAATAGLPSFPIVRVEAISEDEDAEEAFGPPEVVTDVPGRSRTEPGS